MAISIIDIPIEILEIICQFLGIFELISLSSTCRDLHRDVSSFKVYQNISKISHDLTPFDKYEKIDIVPGTVKKFLLDHQLVKFRFNRDEIYFNDELITKYNEELLKTKNIVIVKRGVIIIFIGQFIQILNVETFNKFEKISPILIVSNNDDYYLTIFEENKYGEFYMSIIFYKFTYHEKSVIKYDVVESGEIKETFVFFKYGKVLHRKEKEWYFFDLRVRFYPTCYYEIYYDGYISECNQIYKELDIDRNFWLYRDRINLDQLEDQQKLYVFLTDPNLINNSKIFESFVDYFEKNQNSFKVN